MVAGFRRLRRRGSLPLLSVRSSRDRSYSQPGQAASPQGGRSGDKCGVIFFLTVQTEVREIQAGETSTAFDALRVLRPSLPDTPQSFETLIDTVLRSEGYRLVGVFGAEPSAMAVLGFRQLTTLAWGRILYVDDLSTVPSARRRGFGHRLLAWTADEARRRDCDQLHLDSGVGPTRADAHRLYFNSGLQIGSFHFSRSITDRR